MSFTDAIRTCLRQYAGFQGRAPRSEFWWFILFVVLVGAGLGATDAAFFGMDERGNVNGLFSTIFSLAMLLPIIAVSIRRLHDRDMTGWWYLLVLLPVIGGLILLFFYVQKGTEGDNRFGPDPLA